MISAKELNPHSYDTTPDVKANLAVLLEKINVIREAWGKPMIVTSGLRSQADQQRINPSAPHSKHLSGEACDISDPDGSLMAWVKANEDLIVRENMWIEDGTVGWVHFQICPPKSAHRFFIP